jgi:hypothetical protein
VRAQLEFISANGSVGPSCHLAQAFLHWAGAKVPPHCIDAAGGQARALWISAGEMVLVVVVNLVDGRQPR